MTSPGVRFAPLLTGKGALTGSPEESAYRGVGRDYPGPPDESDAEALDKWLAYVEESDDGWLLDLKTARVATQTFRSLGYPVELVAAVDPDGDVPGLVPLGFDVTAPSLAPLGERFRWWSDSGPAGPLLRLLETHFHPRLNDFLLLDEADDARTLADCLNALSELMPTIFEGESFRCERVLVERVAPSGA